MYVYSVLMWALLVLFAVIAAARDRTFKGNVAYALDAQHTALNLKV